MKLGLFGGCCQKNPVWQWRKLHSLAKRLQAGRPRRYAPEVILTGLDYDFSPLRSVTSFSFDFIISRQVTTVFL